MAPISTIVYFDGDYTGDDYGENFESTNSVSLKFIPRITIAALFSKIKRLVPSGNTKTLKTFYYRFQKSMVHVSYATMTIQTQEDVEAMVDTHHGNGADICELYADFQISSSSKDSYQEFSFPPYSATPYDNFGFPSFSTPSFQHFEHEEPIQELGPDGSEIGLFTTPIDANADVDSDSSNDDDNPQQEQHHASTSIAHQHYQPPPHMYNIDMDALHVHEFPEMPNLGFSGSYGGLNDSELWIGMQFETIDQAKTAIKLYNIRKSMHSKVTISTSEKYVLYNEPHTCFAVGHRQDHPNLDSTIISQTVQPIVQASPKVTVSALMGHVRSVYHYEPEYKKTWRGKDKAIRKLHGDWDASYNDIPAWINIMQMYNPRTIADLETLPSYRNDRVVQDVRQFHRLFWTFPQCINAFKSCKPIIQVDVTFLYGRYKQVLLLAVVQDGNRKTIPIPFALVPREDTDSCKFFLKKITSLFF
ncbi:hypothetical protein GQ457_13G009580 [Hibiscus cannabinus]